MRYSPSADAMTDQLRRELEALRAASRKKADDTRRLADRLEQVIAARADRQLHESPRHTTGPGDRAKGRDSSTPLAHTLHLQSGMEPEERLAQREALERLQNEMREHVADAASLADRIAALQVRIDKALAELAAPDLDTTPATDKLDL